MNQIDEAVARGINFVLGAQQADGSWADWSLPPGQSREWTTAHVGTRLSDIGARRPATLAEPLDRAARFLLSRRAETGGWGYNRRVEPDADSTAQALLLLAAVGHRAPPEAYDFLAKFQQRDGGFATFLPGPLTGSWGTSHAEITPTALLAMRGSPAPEFEHSLARGISWLRKARRLDGLWNSFWWSTPLVATEGCISFLGTLGGAEAVPPPALMRWESSDALESALVISIVAVGGTTGLLNTLVQKVLAKQADDGSWGSAPALRITPRDCDRPWEHNEMGRLYSDSGRLHTTVTVIAALSKAQNAMLEQTQTRDRSRP